MKLYLNPQRSDNELRYVFDGDSVTATYNNDLTETFDLTEIYEEAGDGGVRLKSPETLPVNPIVSVEETGGVLHVRVLRYHGVNPPHEIAWPEWIEVVDGATYPHPIE